MEDQKKIPVPAKTLAESEPAEFITQATLLKRIPISRRTAFEWRKKGTLPAVKVGDKILYHWPTVRDSLLSQQS